MPEVTAIRVVVSGLVQGVGFRATSCLVARRLGLTGWARNLPDGRVEVLAQGPEEDLARFRAWLREGPSGSRVLEVEVADAEPDLSLQAFVILP